MARCPGCRHRELSAEESEAQKLAWLGQALEPWREALRPVRGARGDSRWGYRERACLRTEWDGSRWRAGLLLPTGRFERGVKPIYELLPIPGCPIHSERARRWIEALCARLPGPAAGCELAFIAVSGGIVTLVLKQKTAPLEALAAACAEAAPDAVGVYAHLNPSVGNRVFASREWRLLRGQARDRGPVGVHGPRSFQQLIPELYEAALAEAREFLRPARGTRVLDLCSGIGASLARWADAGADALGVELDGEAVECSEENLRAAGGVGPAVEGAVGAEIAGPRARVLRGRASERIPQLEAWLASAARGDARPAGETVAFANPPRLGLEAEVTEWLARRARPARMAYLSCSAGTLARDLSILAEAGYVVRRITPYDFFPQTHHIETLALLELG